MALANWAIAIAVLMIAVGQLINLEAGSPALERVMLLLWLFGLLGFVALAVVAVATNMFGG